MVAHDQLRKKYKTRSGTMENQESIRRRIAELRIEHRNLGDVIDRVSQPEPFDQLKLQRLKKRKLELKDKIQRLRSKLIPDDIA